MSKNHFSCCPVLLTGGGDRHFFTDTLCSHTPMLIFFFAQNFLKIRFVLHRNRIFLGRKSSRPISQILSFWSGWRCLYGGERLTGSLGFPDRRRLRREPRTRLAEAGPCPQYADYGVLIISEYGNHKRNIVKSSTGPSHPFNWSPNQNLVSSGRALPTIRGLWSSNHMKATNRIL